MIDLSSIRDVGRCTECGSEQIRTIDTRQSDGIGNDSGTVRRKRRCVECGAMWYTIEIDETNIDELVQAHLESVMDQIRDVVFSLADKGETVDE